MSLPWWLKLSAKLVLARLPLNYRLWQNLHLFRHGSMDDADYVIDIFHTHVQRAGYSGDLSNKCILELGPGDSIATALMAAAYGAQCILLDAGRFANGDLQLYQGLADALRGRGLAVPDLAGVQSLDEILQRCNARYLTNGLSSLASLEAASVDIAFSHAVLEHVRRHEFQETMNACYRVLTPEGTMSHNVDLRDHLTGSLNHLRFSERVWESDFFVHSGFYTNRLQFDAMLTMFTRAGFVTEVVDKFCWDRLPLARKQLADPFNAYSESRLNVYEFNVVLSKSAGLQPI